jgi:Transmembrane domain of unknown function (DUF3566)
MVIRRVNPISAAKVNGVLCAILGFVIGAFWSLMIMALGSMASLSSSSEGGGPAAGIIGLVMGAGAIIVLPIFYGVLGFIGGLIYAALYNLVAKWTGGLEIEAA